MIIGPPHCGCHWWFQLWTDYKHCYKGAIWWLLVTNTMLLSPPYVDKATVFDQNLYYLPPWSYGVMVSTQDSESCDPSSNLGRTYYFFILMFTTVVNLSRSVFVRFGYQWWLIILERLDCTGTVIGPFTKQILTHSKCCPSDATLIVSHGISGSFVLRISRRYHNGKLQCRARNVHLYTNKVIFASGQSYRAFG